MPPWFEFTPAEYIRVGGWRGLPDERPREKAALGFAHLMSSNHLAIGDELMDELKRHFSEREIMALGWRIAIFVGYGRLVYATGLESVGEPCPVSFTPPPATG